MKVNPELIIQRTGIRFINIFDFPLLTLQNANEYFSDSISTHLTTNNKTTSLSRSFLINEYVYDEIKLKQQTGYYNPDYPALVKRPNFVLDFDAYIDFPHQINNTESYFSTLHAKIEEHFESCIKDRLRSEVLNA